MYKKDTTQIYVRKLYEHDITHEVSVKSDIVSDFFDNQRTDLKFVKSGNTLTFSVDINSATDPRFGGEFDRLYQNEVVGDILVIRKEKGFYSLTHVKQSDAIHPFLDQLFLPNQRHAIFAVPVTALTQQQNNSIDEYLKFLLALRAKPFLLLAGISGTGKSRIVRDFAYRSCPSFMQGDISSPGNYCMIEVKPNWHDSTELLGYDKTIKKEYYVTSFMKFLVKAHLYPEVPFFVCLDEMNLAPVEQYFAEFLSVLETRTRKGDHVVSGALVKKDIFEKYSEEEEERITGLNSAQDRYDIFEALGMNQQPERNTLSSEQDLEANVTQRSTPAVSNDSDTIKFDDDANSFDASNNTIYPDYTRVRNYLLKHGLTLPDNLFVIGTVNMDDTTYQFSRKVIDRAMTIEMNGGDLKEMFNHRQKLTYSNNPLPLSAFLGTFLDCEEVLEKLPDYADQIKEKVPQKLEEINRALEGTPFQISYRVQNELVVYVGVLIEHDIHRNTPVNIDTIINKAVDQILMMKILPRIEGDDDLLKSPLSNLSAVISANNYNSSRAKIEEMIMRLNSGFTRFWP